MRVKSLAALAGFAAVVASVSVTACGDPTAIGASFSNRDTSVTLYAMNGTPANVPSAMAVRIASPVTIGPTFAFDIAFDLNAANEVVVYTARLVASGLLPVQRVGLQLTTDAFESVVTAPTRNYVYDSLLVVPLNRTVLVDLLDPQCVQTIVGPDIRAKFVIDSVNLSQRAIYVHVLSNPNCGFKSLVPGLPKD